MAAAGASADQARAVAGSTAGPPRRRARVQPQAWEFSAPYGASDMSPADARDADGLYRQLINSTLAQCPTGDHSGTGEHC